MSINTRFVIISVTGYFSTNTEVYGWIFVVCLSDGISSVLLDAIAFLITLLSWNVNISDLNCVLYFFCCFSFVCLFVLFFDAFFFCGE